MAWTGQVARTERNGDQLDIIVSYIRDDGNTFDQTIRTNVAHDGGWLQGLIQDKLIQLNDLDGYEGTVNDSQVSQSTLSIDTKQALNIQPIKVLEEV